MTRRAAVIGWPIEHTRSPAMMNAAFAATGIDAEMIAMAVPLERLAATLADVRRIPMLGASITIPHKVAVIASCAELAPAARAIGAVNCIAVDRERDLLIGHNTDAGGFADALGGSLNGARVVLVGAGGAARAVAYGAAQAGARVEVVARSPATVSWTTARPWAELDDAFGHADVVVDCTPAALDPTTDAELAASLPLDALSRAAQVVSLVYHRRSRLLERAAERGHSTLDGRAMLVHQGARAFTIWTSLPAPIEIMARALDESVVKTP